MKYRQLLPQKHIAIWNFNKNEISAPVKVKGEFGNLFAISDKKAWDMFKFPKIINIQTGKLKVNLKIINSGYQTSSILYSDIKDSPQICFDRQTSKMAIRIDNTMIEVVSPDIIRRLTGGLAIWRGDEYILNFLFANRLQFQPTNKAKL